MRAGNHHPQIVKCQCNPGDALINLSMPNLTSPPPVKAGRTLVLYGQDFNWKASKSPTKDVNLIQLSFSSLLFKLTVFFRVCFCIHNKDLLTLIVQLSLI